MKKTILIMSLLFIVNSKAQVNIGGVPYSFNNTLKQEKPIPIFTTNSINLQSLEKEDLQDEKDNVPPRFGYKHAVNLNIENSGLWTELPNGDKIWQLEIHCPKAKSINFTFDKFWLPQNGKLYIYNKDKSHVIGGFTYLNNKSDKRNPRGFATGLVYGEDVILEYYHKKNDEFPLISINGIVHGYRYIAEFMETNKTESFGSSGSCNINVNCTLGDDWQDEKTGVAMIMVGSSRICTGSLINNTCNDGTLYFLTANHCVSPLNAPSNLDDWSFVWNYEAPNCTNPTSEPTLYTTNGANLVSNYSTSDFALLLLDESPLDLNMSQGVMFNGWSTSSTAAVGVIGIHHPSGDIKKISKENATVQLKGYGCSASGNNHWKVPDWDEGTTEGGSSGSPLFNMSSKIIGQLHGGDAACGNNSCDSYGAFHYSWSTNSNIRKQLKHWLDPCETDQEELEGGYWQECDMYKYVNYPINSFEKVEASGTIYGSSSIENNTQAIFLAGEQVILTNGFHAKASSDFIARIQDCEGKVVPPANKTEKKSSELLNNEDENNTVVDLLKIYPNPSSEIFNIEISIENINDVKLSLTDMSGRKYIIPHSFYKGFNRIQLNMKDFTKGAYIINFTNSDNTITKKIILK